MVVLGQKWFSSGKSGFIRKEVVFGKKWLRANGDCDVTESYLEWRS